MVVERKMLYYSHSCNRVVWILSLRSVLIRFCKLCWQQTFRFVPVNTRYNLRLLYGFWLVSTHTLLKQTCFNSTSHLWIKDGSKISQWWTTISKVSSPVTRLKYFTLNFKWRQLNFNLIYKFGNQFRSTAHLTDCQCSHSHTRAHCLSHVITWNWRVVSCSVIRDSIHQDFLKSSIFLVFRMSNDS